MILNNIVTLDETFFEKKFANRLLSDQRTLRIGNIVSFVSTVKQGLILPLQASYQTINFCCEIPEISNYAGVCLQQLFLTNIANLLANKYINVPVEIINNDIIIKKEHKNQGIHQVDGIVSSTFLKRINETIILYVGLYNQTFENSVNGNSPPRAFALHFDEKKCKEFMDDANSNFYMLINNIFLQTSKMS